MMSSDERGRGDCCLCSSVSLQEALSLGQESPGGASGELSANSDLTLEAAHNLVLIYQASGAIGLARATMRKYLVI